MAAFTFNGYFDESGDESNNPRVLSFAGYIASVGTWEIFEAKWKAVLDEFHVKYFHMREFCHSVEEFAEWKGDDARRRDFVQALTNTVADSGSDLFGVCAVVEMADLKRFNEFHSQDLEAYSFCMSRCFVELVNYLIDKQDGVNAVCDKISRAYARIAMAFKYLASDPYYKTASDIIAMTPILKSQSFKTVIPLQLADFAAWEVRKACESKSQWLSETPEDEQTVMNWFLWKNLKPQETSRKPGDVILRKSLMIPTHWTGERGSVVSLIKAAPLRGYYWGYDDIADFDARKNIASSEAL
jgi:hypothetical protein